MLGLALREPDPVVIFEHALLYPMEGELNGDGPLAEWPTAAVRRSGSDLTLVTYGGSLHKCLEAAKLIANEGIEAEVVDLRSLRPLDMATVCESIARTHRALIVDEGWKACGVAAEIITRVVEEAFYELDAPLARVCSIEVPMPYPKHLEDAALPSVERIVSAIREMLSHG
jgi:pyruvate dehydrogenase E1 component beta subunit